MKTLKPKSLAIFQAGGKQFPKSPISLLEIMREFIAYNVCQWDSTIEELHEQTAKRPAGTLLSKKELKRIKYNFDLCFGEDHGIEAMGWDEFENRMLNLDSLLDLKSHPKRPVTAESVNRAVFELKLAFLNELAPRKFVEIEKNKADFLEQKNLFGKQVGKAFPSANDEIKAAGNCLAMDLNTAAVFHLMRAAEIGMRALAVSLGVKLTHKGKRKPIEHGGWNEIIEKIEKEYKGVEIIVHVADPHDEIIQRIENKIQERRGKYDKSTKKNQNRKEFEFLKFCRIMADELYRFKELDRDNTMHSIRSYNEAEAKGVFDRVRDFMQRLSKEVSEK
jgi:hypothetical protein